MSEGLATPYTARAPGLRKPSARMRKRENVYGHSEGKGGMGTWEGHEEEEEERKGGWDAERNRD